MELYTKFFGVNPLAEHLLNVIGMEPEHWGEFRDIYLHEEKGKLYIGIYTRLGGPNRIHVRENQPGVNCECNACIITCKAKIHKLYVKDYDNPFDIDYATIIFNIPIELRVDMKKVYKKTKDSHLRPDEKHGASIKMVFGIQAILERDSKEKKISLIEAVELMKAEEESESMKYIIDFVYDRIKPYKPIIKSIYDIKDKNASNV